MSVRTADPKELIRREETAKRTGDRRAVALTPTELGAQIMLVIRALPGRLSDYEQESFAQTMWETILDRETPLVFTRGNTGRNRLTAMARGIYEGRGWRDSAASYRSRAERSEARRGLVELIAPAAPAEDPDDLSAERYEREAAHIVQWDDARNVRASAVGRVAEAAALRLADAKPEVCAWTAVQRDNVRLALVRAVALAAGVDPTEAFLTVAHADAVADALADGCDPAHAAQIAQRRARPLHAVQQAAKRGAQILRSVGPDEYLAAYSASAADLASVADAPEDRVSAARIAAGAARTVCRASDVTAARLAVDAHLDAAGAYNADALSHGVALDWQDRTGDRDAAPFPALRQRPMWVAPKHRTREEADAPQTHSEALAPTALADRAAQRPARQPARQIVSVTAYGPHELEVLRAMAQPPRTAENRGRAASARTLTAALRAAWEVLDSAE